MRTCFALALLIGCAGGSRTPPQLDSHGTSSGEVDGEVDDEVDPASLGVTAGGPPITMLELGGVVLGENRARTVRIRNSAAFSPISLSVDNPVFATDGECSALGQGDSCEVSISFEPRLAARPAS